MAEAQVTARGVSEGDPETLRGLTAVRGPAVLAFCTEVCGPRAPYAAAEAFARFRAAVHDADDLAALDPEGLLLNGTRHAAASMSQLPPAPAGGLLRRRDPQTCERVPALLAARASGHLGAADQERLARHLGRCDRCRSIEAAFARAERAYEAAEPEPLDAATGSLLVSALASAAPTVGAPRPAGGEAGPAEEPAEAPALPAAEAAAELGEAAEVPHEEPAGEIRGSEEHDEAAEGDLGEGDPAERMAGGDDDDPEDPDDQLGETMEWSAVAEGAADPPPPQPHVGQPSPVLTGGAPDQVLGGGRSHTRPASRLKRAAVPTVVLASGVAVALSIAGAFRDDPPAASTTVAPLATGLPAPVTTPLPLPPGDTSP